MRKWRRPTPAGAGPSLFHKLRLLLDRVLVLEHTLGPENPFLLRARGSDFPSQPGTASPSAEGFLLLSCRVQDEEVAPSLSPAAPLSKITFSVL